MKIICAEAEFYGGGIDEYDTSCVSGEVKLNTYDSILELLSKNPQVRQDLIAACWVPLKEIKEVVDKTILENNFYIHQNAYGVHLREIDITAIDNQIVNSIANQGGILQKIDPKSVLSPDQYKIVAAAIQRNKNIEKGRAAALLKRAENAKAKKLEKAKKLLEEAKLLVGEKE